MLYASCPPPHLNPDCGRNDAAIMPDCHRCSDGGRIGPTDFPENPMELEHYALSYADEAPVAIPMYELEMVAGKMPMRSTHGSLDPWKGPRVYQTTRLLHQQLPNAYGCRCSGIVRIGRCSDRCGCRCNVALSPFLAL